jgi:predicted enzyme related to lactoylglutathione lyase
VSDPYNTAKRYSAKLGEYCSKGAAFLKTLLVATELAMNKPNAVGWFDLYVNDMSRAVAFYESVFQQRLEQIGDPTGETLMRAFPSNMNAYGAAGALVKSPHSRPGAGGTMIYFSVNDCAIEQERVTAAGGQVLRPKFSIGEFGWVTLCLDTEGNVFGLSSMQ